MKNLLSNPKFKNPMFWVSLVSIIFGFAGVDFNTLTSWPLFMEAVLSIFNNPVAIVAIMLGVVGIFNDNGTPGVDSLIHKE